MSGARDRGVDAILARFPGPVTLRVSRLKWFAVLAGGLGFVAIGVFMLRGDIGGVDRWDVLIAWACLVFFGLVALVAAVMLLPGAGSLTLAAEGFETCNLFRRFRTPWQQASDFTVGEYDAQEGWLARPQRLVVYDDSRCVGALADLNRRMLGRNGALPDTYGLSYDDLARLMTQWRERALTAPHGRSVVPRIRRQA
jgi:hypothetical protein